MQEPGCCIRSPRPAWWTDHPSVGSLDMRSRVRARMRQSRSPTSPPGMVEGPIQASGEAGAGRAGRSCARQVKVAGHRAQPERPAPPSNPRAEAAARQCMLEGDRQPHRREPSSRSMTSKNVAASIPLVPVPCARCTAATSHRRRPPGSDGSGHGGAGRAPSRPAPSPRRSLVGRALRPISAPNATADCTCRSGAAGVARETARPQLEILVALHGAAAVGEHG